MHDHAPAGGIRDASNRRLLTTALTLTASVMVVQIVGAILSGSLALLADAAHMFTDAAALVVALIATAIASRPADDRRTFGYQRAEVLGALANGVILIVLCAWVGIEAVQRLLTPAEAEVQGGLMLVVAAVGMVANAISMWVLSRAQKRSINVRGAYLEVLGDLVGSIAVIIAAIVIVTTGFTQADAIASLLIAVLIVPRAVGLLREVVVVLTESAPVDVHVAEIRQHLRDTDGVVDVHDVHVWQLTRGAPVFSAHVIVEDEALTDGRAARILESLQGCLAEHFDVEHSTFQLEPAGHVEHDTRHA
jgi:cobalt-zinc-cadmium efflux system protein